jgi:methionine synthase II (cobalamin-independent)
MSPWAGDSEEGANVHRVQFASGIATGIGSLPHRDAAEAARFSLASIELPTIPSLPKRSPAEGMIAQAMVGMRGITVGQYGSIAVDISRVDPMADVVTDIDHDAFGGFRAFLCEAGDHTGPVKWQFVGPVTLGMAMLRAGVPVHTAFEAAVRAVRAHVQNLIEIVATAMPDAQQLVFIDEPSLGELMHPGFPIAPDTAIDLVSGALAAIEPRAVAGLHVCADSDIASQLASGPSVLSVPVRMSLVDSAGYLIRFLERGGTIAWGVVPTSGPIATSVERPWRQLSAVWCKLVERGADPVLLRSQAMVTPECGLGLHSPSVAERVHAITADVGRRVRDQAVATRFVLGA